MEYIWKTIYRAPMKSILFIILLGMISSVFCIGLNLQAVTQINTSRTKDSFNIIAVLNSDSADVEKWQNEYKYIKSLPYVLVYEPSEIAASSNQIIKPKEGNHDGINPIVSIDLGTNKTLYSKEQTVIIGTYIGDSMMRIEDCLYGNVECEGLEMPIINLSSFSGSFEKGKEYIAYGKIASDTVDNKKTTLKKEDSDYRFEIFNYDPRYYIGNGSNFIENANSDSLYKNVTDSYCGVELNEKRSLYWEDMVKSFLLSDYPVIVMSVNNSETIYDFHERKTWLVNGVDFGKKDYEEGKFKCLIDYITAEDCNLKVGDKINLHFYISLYLGFDADLEASSYSPSYPNYWGNDYGEEEFEIIGIFNRNDSGISMEDDNTILHHGMILIPEKSMASVIGSKTIDEFRLGTIPNQLKYISVKVETEYIEQFLKEVSQLHELKATVYDQGYSTITRIINRFNELAQRVMVLAGLCAVLLIGVFIFLDYLKRRTEVQVMNALGCGSKRIGKHLLMAILIISFPASVIGGVVGHYVSGKVIEKIQVSEFANQSSVAYAEYYSNSSNINIKLYFGTEWFMVLITVILINIIIIFFGFLGAYITIKNNRNKSKKGKNRASV